MVLGLITTILILLVLAILTILLVLFLPVIGVFIAILLDVTVFITLIKFLFFRKKE